MVAVPLDLQNFECLLKNHDSFLFDCDGVLWHGNTLIPGAAEALSLLKAKGKQVFYVTNNSTSTREQYAEKCRKLGLPAEKKEIVCTAHSAALYLQDLLRPTFTCRPKVYLVGCVSIADELNAVGIDSVGLGPDPVGENFTQDKWRSVELEDDIDAVVVGFDPHISFIKILKAASYLKKPLVHFVATNTDQSFPTTSSRIVVPGTGCVVAPIAMAADRIPTVMGKPETLMFEYLQKEFELDSAKCVFIGDRLNTDILLAHKCGMKSVMALSGVSTLEEVEKYQNSSDPQEKLLVPHFFMSDINVLKELLEQIN
ncbi:glycerol-3-phosphate phosphatase-like [Paramacrobiotus metropolitanus]|uniref:glycerol-3-phosphate phosphatase-like n=1 Tax=Paramacrobiotus metropolitanus TaxID=2943436 RepID=UPI0024464B9D|nr:glycerol-3-phosphate phosphatase-like [Paramacrobiotus metropolitanus]